LKEEMSDCEPMIGLIRLFEQTGQKYVWLAQYIGETPDKGLNTGDLSAYINGVKRVPEHVKTRICNFLGMTERELYQDVFTEIKGEEGIDD